MMTLGKGAVISNSNNQKLNAGSSTESKLVATHDQMSDVLHTLYFIEAQGYAIDKNVIYQDKQSPIRLELNGKLSSGKKTKHISSRFFFITDKVARGEVDVEYCPAEKMWCDILNKPKQGASYRLDRSYLMNVPIEYDDDVERRLTHPALLDKGDDDDVTIPPLDQKQRKASTCNTSEGYSGKHKHLMMESKLTSLNALHNIQSWRSKISRRGC